MSTSRAFRAAAASAMALVFGLVPATPATGETSTAYTFEADAVGSRPADTRVLAGDFEVVADPVLGKALQATREGDQGFASAALTRIVASDIRLTWREANHSGDSHGFMLRKRSYISGYLFVVNTLNASNDDLLPATNLARLGAKPRNSVQIWKIVSDNTFTRLAEAFVPPMATGWYAAEARGTTLTLSSSADGVTWSPLLSYDDHGNSPFMSGGVQFFAGIEGDARTTAVDDVVATYTEAPGVVDVTGPSDDQVVQRQPGGTSVPVRGTYQGSPTAIEARWAGGPWTVIDASPAGGEFHGSLDGLPDGQGPLEVRFANAPSVTSVRDPVGIGDLFVVAGQSNAVGHGWNRNGYAHPTLKAGMYGASTQVDGSTYLPGDRWRELTDEVYGSAWPLVATRALASQGVPVAFVLTARDGSSIDAWQPGQPQFEEMANRVAAVGGRVRAVLFWQGETDALNGMSRETYRAKLQAFAAEAAKRTGGSVVAAQIGNAKGVADAKIDAVRLAQSDAWSDAADAVLPGPVLYDVNLEDEGGDGVHFQSAGDLSTAAERWWKAVSAAVYGTGDGRGPQLASASLTADRSAITLRFTDASLPLSGGTGGYAVRLNGLAQPVGAQRTAPDTVTLRPAAPLLVGDVTVSLGEGNGAGGADVPRDANALPAEPFVGRPVS